ncbi:indolepyruvate ferredoxin oxidoreductase family protein [Phenylobacterium sp. LH3H17]|uniref:indolepyruvate ferredoxin oxidoreductase family protein n=1 Tax=Phenylobacterium sp. LH3H17 TaxID=2903901 RepID=UPI0020C9FAAF|nr:indolepyruvate ferredoxin oxidoreductase family protein [Phenylobacterium sp. LH3H17]UTP38314.1 indolepyruvate ferredoxin oxidoreductase family protein [Phenylobacterium sp. LH3H17]
MLTSDAAMNQVSLSDPYEQRAGRVLMSGVQALGRLLMLRGEEDRRAGLRTAGYVSGYRGSPLGGLDAELLRIKAVGLLPDVVVDPGLNEDLAVTAVLGTQQISQFDPTVDGVFALWYAKGPGVDRSCDALKHGNMAGVSPNGGVLVVFGDDHPGKSSTVAHQSEPALSTCSIPVLYPASVEEILTFGQLGWALSRASGLWVGLKLVNETAECAGTVDLDAARITVTAPVMSDMPAEGVHFRGVFGPQRDEVLITRHKLPLAKAFARANRLDRLAVDSAEAALCVVTAGKAYVDVMQALARLGVDEARAAKLGLRVYKVGMIWPLEAEGLRAAAHGCREVLVVEEKRAFLEVQAAAALINTANPPRLVGKFDETGAPLLPADEQLDPAQIAEVLLARLAGLGCLDADTARAAARAPAAATGSSALLPARLPYFCSGCPHNRSTKVPEGSLALSGIGCHGMAIWMNRQTLPAVQMGGEGANWIGASRFSKRPHIFQNLGDGTYSHSGLLAVRAAVNAGVNLTYKILFNDAVAMTGGQAVEGGLSVADIARQVLAEGARRCVVLSDDMASLDRRAIPAGVDLRPRADLEAVQQALRVTPGVTVVIFSQVCATEKRRRRKRGLESQAPRRLFINEAVCENCGDCSAVSNCVSLRPIPTALGRKREIDQSGCNQDYSCADGFCPSFVSVTGGRPRARAPRLAAVDPARLPEPGRVPAGDRCAILVTGIGGSGVITVGSVLAMAAHLEGKIASTYNMTGLAQKGGAVHSHLRIGLPGMFLGPARLGDGETDLLLACDLVAGAHREALATLRPGTAIAVVNTRLTPTAAFQLDPDFVLDGQTLESAVACAVGEGSRVHRVDAAGTAADLFGDSLAANMFMVGFAYQLGAIPLKAASIEAAVRLNAAAVDMNLSAFRTGRLAVLDPTRIAGLRAPPAEREPAGLEALIADRAKRLTAYQHDRYAADYEVFVRRVGSLVTARDPGGEAITEAVARGLAKLMAYKDEYEVARLLADPSFSTRLRAEFEGELKLSFHLSPPLFAPRDRASGLPLKVTLGGWVMPVFRLLAKFKGLRGTPFDPFGGLAERRLERRLVGQYRASVEAALELLNPGTRDLVLEVACYPDLIRGFGHVKAERLVGALRRRDVALARLRGEAAEPAAIAPQPGNVAVAPHASPASKRQIHRVLDKPRNQPQR